MRPGDTSIFSHLRFMDMHKRWWRLEKRVNTLSIIDCTFAQTHPNLSTLHYANVITQNNRIPVLVKVWQLQNLLLFLGSSSPLLRGLKECRKATDKTIVNVRSFIYRFPVYIV
jgi:hypothetical protein